MQSSLSTFRSTIGAFVCFSAASASFIFLHSSAFGFGGLALPLLGTRFLLLFSVVLLQPFVDHLNSTNEHRPIIA
jgi:hypothetical protein